MPAVLVLSEETFLQSEQVSEEIHFKSYEKQKIYLLLHRTDACLFDSYP